MCTSLFMSVIQPQWKVRLEKLEEIKFEMWVKI